jgi:hypothetical protein
MVRLNAEIQAAIIGGAFGALVGAAGSFALYYFDTKKQYQQQYINLISEFKHELIKNYIFTKEYHQIINESAKDLPLSSLHINFLEELLKKGLPNKWIKRNNDIYGLIVDIYTIILDINKYIQYRNDPSIRSIEESRSKLNQKIITLSEILGIMLMSLSQNNLNGLGIFHEDIIKMQEGKFLWPTYIAKKYELQAKQVLDEIRSMEDEEKRSNPNECESGTTFKGNKNCVGDEDK